MFERELEVLLYARLVRGCFRQAARDVAEPAAPSILFHSLTRGLPARWYLQVMQTWIRRGAHRQQIPGAMLSKLGCVRIEGLSGAHPGFLLLTFRCACGILRCPGQ